MFNPVRRRSSPSTASARGRRSRSARWISSHEAPSGVVMLTIVLLTIHGLVAVALLGAITHQTLAIWVPAGARSGSFFARFRGVRPASFANAVIVFYLVT